MKTIDHFVLRERRMSFTQLHKAVAKTGLLATPQRPFGVVIIIPPNGGIAGIEVLGRGYADTEAMYQLLLDAIGDRQHMAEDHPLAVA